MQVTKRLKLYAILCIFALTAGFVVYKSIETNKWKSLAYSLALQNDSVIMLQDNMQAKLANRILLDDSLKTELRAAKDLNAKLVAAGRARIIFDTITSEVIIKDTVFGDSGIFVTFSDTVELGIMGGVITVSPPPRRDVNLLYSFALNPVDLSMSFYQTKNDSVFFAVHSTIGRTVIGTSYAGFRPPERRIVKYVEGSYGIGAILWEARAGVGLNLGAGWQVSPEIQAMYLYKENLADGSLRLVVRKVF